MFCSPSASYKIYESVKISERHARCKRHSLNTRIKIPNGRTSDTSQLDSATALQCAISLSRR
ncbi:hypothetical protein E2C01_100653 [Portunus trituberculatus]|uniref:Uncharacterized protein n=1 Tax=Portunus trituberculatus TaxID=210409 RepID=A0A5B7KIG9_PORTR|nr:hypothetical protein [Portunus trituberculatus]